MGIVSYVVINNADGAVVNIGACDQDLLHTKSGATYTAFAVPEACIQFPNVVLPPLQAVLSLRVDQQAEAIRQRYITVGDGQVLEYQRAIEQARACLAVPETIPAAGVYPALDADVEAGAIDPRTNAAVPNARKAAEVVILTYDAYGAIGDRIRAARKGAKVAILSAVSVPACYAAAEVDWEAVLEG